MKNRCECSSLPCICRPEEWNEKEKIVQNPAYLHLLDPKEIRAQIDTLAELLDNGGCKILEWEDRERIESIRRLLGYIADDLE